MADVSDGTDASSEVTPLRGNTGLAQWGTLTQYSHVMACRRPTLRLYSVNMVGDLFAMGISSRKPWLGQPLKKFRYGRVASLCLIVNPLEYVLNDC